jgi:DNA-binding beta-propeller fold protein YncE
MNKDGISTESIIFNQDSKIISSGKYLYILERSTDANISRIDATQLSNGNDAVQYQQSLGSKANPEDVAIVNSTLGWIALSGRDHLLAFNPETGVLTDSVSLAGFKQEGENSPNPTSLVLKGDTLCVIMQRLKLWTPDMPGLVALLHAKTGAIIDTIQLKGSNPNGAVLVGSKLYVANSGDLMNTELNEKKSLDVVDFAQGSASVFVSGATLGGGPSGIAVDIDSGILYVGVYKDFGDEPIASIQIANKTVTTFSDVIDSFGGIAFDPEAKLLYVGDRAFGKEAVKVWNGTTFQTVVNNGALPAMGIAVVTY